MIYRKLYHKILFLGYSYNLPIYRYILATSKSLKKTSIGWFMKIFCLTWDAIWIFWSRIQIFEYNVIESVSQSTLTFL